MGEDKILHFICSFILVMALLGIFLAFIPRLRNNSPRFWHVERNIYSAFFTMIFTLGFLSVLVIGMGKEQIDAWGFGDVEFGDFVADVAGIALGLYLAKGQIRRQFSRQKRVSFHSQIQSIRANPMEQSNPQAPSLNDSKKKLGSSGM